VLAYGDARRLLQCISAGQSGDIEIARVIVPQEDDPDRLSEVLSPESLRRDRLRGIIVVAGDGRRVPARLLLRCRLEGFRVLDEVSFLEQEGYRIDVDAHDLGWLLSGNGFRLSRVVAIERRVFDLIIASLLLVLTLPLMLLIAILVKVDSRGPALYRQDRVGFSGRIFTLYKFRSMHQDAEADGSPTWAAVADPRVTRVGRFIRYARIDELPQLLNVLRGEMSIIGPRPERPYFVEKLAAAIPLYHTRHYIKPGITGWAQVNASYGASTEDAREKLCYDLYYIKHRGFLLDLSILLRTLRVVVLGEGAR
jgi:exopolysaccharide biosynthesis polyprenyl glycosylphosphotransferase